MTRVLDVNVLLALAWPQHEFHSPARVWFNQLSDLWATCPMTECAFIRISMNLPGIIGRVTASQAQHELPLICERPRHVFFPDDLSARELSFRTDTGHKQITDAYLLALAVKNGAILQLLTRGYRVRQRISDYRS